MSSIPSNKMPSSEEIFHSSEYAKEAYGKAIGSTSPITYDQRLHIDNNRLKIRSYRDSMIARVHDRRNRHNADIKIQQTGPVNQAENSAKPSPKTPGPDSQKSAGTTIKFREPPSRGYDPYGR